MRTRIATITCLVAVAGCGGGTATDDAGGTRPTAGGSTSAAPTSSGPPVALQGTVVAKGTRDLAGATTLSMDLGDNWFAPTYVRATPGATLMVTLTNSGTAPHTFTVDAPKVDVTVEAGGTGAASVTLPASGGVRFYCKFHAAQGMQGAFYFEVGDVVAGGSAGDGGAYGQ